MKFEADLTVFIDPSYTCTGMMALYHRTIIFGGASRAETKRSLQNYYLAAEGVSHDVIVWLREMIKSSQAKTLEIVMEAPFDGSYASSGLWMLQSLILHKLNLEFSMQDLQSNIKCRLYSLAPSYISGQIKKLYDKKDNTGIRKAWCNERIAELQKQGFIIGNPEQLKAAGCDRQTAFGFWWFLSHSDKELDLFNFNV